MRFTHWDQVLSTKETNEIVKRLSSLHASRICDATERERIASYIAGDRFLDLCDYDFPYATASTWDILCLRQVCAFYSKRADLELGIDRRAIAVGKFVAAERLCAQTNDIFDIRDRGEFCFTPRVESVLHTAQRKISQILGDVPSLCDLKPRFGPGATTQVQKRTASARRKLSQTHACSKELAPFIGSHLEECAGWVFFHDENPEVDSVTVPVEIHTGRLAFVPKTAKTDRAVVVEPAWNGMFQMAIGDHISKRLRHFGVDTRDQTRNQGLARRGSIDNSLATVDLSSASDTIATRVVMDLLPLDWFIFLSRYRTGAIEYEGKTVEQEKFSSMGNGFTFPLETLIFYALAYACTQEDLRPDVSCFGDDIIIPTSGYPLLIEVLTSLGFIPNVDKSFGSGPFRESCGTDYHRGINVRPVYLKDRLGGFDAFRLHNFFVRAGDIESAAILLDYIDPSLRKWGPDGYGDGHLIGDFSKTFVKRDRGWSGYTFETYTFGGRFDYKVLPGDRVYPSYSIYAREGGDGGSRIRGLRELALYYARAQDIPSLRHSKDGFLGVSVPGTRGYKTIRVYVLG